MNTSKSSLDPWRILLSHLMDIDSYKIPNIIDKTGMIVDWTLTEKENWSHKYRRDTLRPRILTAYTSLVLNDQLRVSHTIAAELSKIGRVEDLNIDLKKIGWTIENNKLIPVNASVKELFFPKDAQHDAYVEIKKIFIEASQSIFVIDPYIDNSLLTVFKSITSQPIEICLLTSKLPSDFILESKKFIAQHNKYSIKLKKTKEFHDRFLIIDHTKCWHIGCSIKDAGNKAFMISLIEDAENREALIRQAEKAWTNAQEELI